MHFFLAEKQIVSIIAWSMVCFFFHWCIYLSMNVRRLSNIWSQSWLYNFADTQQSPVLTYGGVLPKDERRHEVPPHARRLEDEKEDAKVLVDDIRALFALLGSLCVSWDGEVGAFGRPQRRAAQSQYDWRGDESVPVEENMMFTHMLALVQQQELNAEMIYWLIDWWWCNSLIFIFFPVSQIVLIIDHRTEKMWNSVSSWIKLKCMYIIAQSL